MAKMLNPHLEEELHQLVEQARTACEVSGSQSNECMVAWDVVEEVQAAISHRPGSRKTSLQTYCDANPEADECRIYDL